jgi:hypothetical protein
MSCTSRCRYRHIDTCRARRRRRGPIVSARQGRRQEGADFTIFRSRACAARASPDTWTFCLHTLDSRHHCLPPPSPSVPPHFTTLYPRPRCHILAAATAPPPNPASKHAHLAATTRLQPVPNDFLSPVHRLSASIQSPPTRTLSRSPSHLPNPWRPTPTRSMRGFSTGDTTQTLRRHTIPMALTTPTRRAQYNSNEKRPTPVAYAVGRALTKSPSSIHANAAAASNTSTKNV